MQAFLVMIGDHVIPPAHAAVAAFAFPSGVISKLESASRLSVLASASSATCAAPARFNTRAQAAAVEPVVNTSSTSNTRAPSNRVFPLRANAPPTFTRRFAFVNPACGAVAVPHGTINERDLSLLSVTDDVDEAVARIVRSSQARTEDTPTSLDG